MPRDDAASLSDEDVPRAHKEALGIMSYPVHDDPLTDPFGVPVIHCTKEPHLRKHTRRRYEHANQSKSDLGTIIFDRNAGFLKTPEADAKSKESLYGGRAGRSIECWTEAETGTREGKRQYADAPTFRSLVHQGGVREDGGGFTEVEQRYGLTRHKDCAGVYVGMNRLPRPCKLVISRQNESKVATVVFGGEAKDVGTARGHEHMERSYKGAAGQLASERRHADLAGRKDPDLSGVKFRPCARVFHDDAFPTASSFKSQLYLRHT